MKQSPMPPRTTPMPHGKPLERRTPLQGSGQLERGTPIRKVSAKRAKANRERRAMVDRLYPDRQPMCGRPGCPRWADDLHEPLTRARGGSITDPDNQVPLCRPCHDELTFTPESELGWAYELGLLRHSEPVSKPWQVIA